MLDSTLIGQVASLGLGAVIAVIILVWKRQDDREHRQQIVDLFSKHDSQVLSLTLRVEQLAGQVVMVVQANAEALTSFTAQLDAIASMRDIQKQLDEMQTQLRQRNVKSGG